MLTRSSIIRKTYCYVSLETFVLDLGNNPSSTIASYLDARLCVRLVCPNPVLRPHHLFLITISRNICITAADGHTGVAIVELLFGELFSKKFDSVTAMVLDPKSEHAIRAKELGAQVVHHEPGRERDVAKALQDSQCDTLCLIPPAHKDKKLITYELIRASKKVDTQCAVHQLCWIRLCRSTQTATSSRIH